MTESATPRHLLERIAPLLMFFLVLAIGYVTTIIYEAPLPRVHDEFAYLLAADTFASGRIVNPPNPEPHLLETFHVIQQPSYQSKYPPGQGAFLGLGQKLLGHPSWGIWIGMALATAVMVRLLRMICPLRIAILFSLAPLFCPPLFWQWTQSYWGGGVAYAGGALFFLGLAASFRQVGLLGALAGTSGVILLSQTRPLEGALTCGLTLLLAWGLMGKTQRKPMLAITIWMAVASIIALLCTLTYNHAVTGDAWSFPHRHWAKSLRTSGLPEQLRTYTGSKPRTHVAEMLRAGKYFIGPFLIILLPGLWWAKHRARIGAALAIVVITAAISIQISAAHPHYLAPILPLIIGLITVAWMSWWQHPRTRVLAVTILALHFAYGGGQILYKIYQRPQWDRFNEREAIVRQLSETDGKHLVFVRYTPQHDVHAEYVYNAADPAQARVIWAREGTDAQRAALIKAYPGVRTWLLEADQRPNTIQPYPGSEDSAHE